MESVGALVSWERKYQTPGSKTQMSRAMSAIYPRLLDLARQRSRDGFSTKPAANVTSLLMEDVREMETTLRDKRSAMPCVCLTNFAQKKFHPNASRNFFKPIRGQCLEDFPHAVTRMVLTIWYSAIPPRDSAGAHTPMVLNIRVVMSGVDLNVTRTRNFQQLRQCLLRCQLLQNASNSCWRQSRNLFLADLSLDVIVMALTKQYNATPLLDFVGAQTPTVSDTQGAKSGEDQTVINTRHCLRWCPYLLLYQPQRRKISAACRLSLDLAELGFPGGFIT